MARRPYAPTIDNRTSRLRIKPRRKPYFTGIGEGTSLGYRRNKTGNGTWVLRQADGRGANWTKAIGTADDYAEANDRNILSYGQAIAAARKLAGRGESEASPVTVAQALDHYAADLKARGANVTNASIVRRHLLPALANRPVALLDARTLRHWRDGMVTGGLKPATADRVGRSLKAALTLAANDDPRITNGNAWRTGLKRLPDSEETRGPGMILSDDEVRRLIAASYEINHAFGLLIEVLATTGQRAGQLLRCTVSDLQNGSAPRLMVPSSRKGRRRRVEHRPLPIPPSLARKLQATSARRLGSDPLLVQEDGAPWPRVDVPTFRRACQAAGLEPTLVPYSLRHSSIVRQLVAGTPARVVAAIHDTSVPMLEKVYSRHIVGDPSDTLVRRALLDAGTDAPADNVVPLPGRP